jgi:hypothetical protein
VGKTLTRELAEEFGEPTTRVTAASAER